MINKSEIYNNLKWWKFSDYVWEEDDEKGLHIKPAPGSHIINYNPWELNDSQTSGKYPLPIYGVLIEKNLDLVLKIVKIRKELSFAKENSKDYHTLKIDFLNIKQRLKENILSFVREYGLLGVFWHKANRIVHQPEYIPILVKKDFSNSKNIFSYASIETMKTTKYRLSDRARIRDDFAFEDEIWKKEVLKLNPVIAAYNEYAKDGKIPKDWRIDGFYIGQLVEIYKDGDWSRVECISDVNVEGQKFLKNLDGRQLEKNFLNDIDFPVEYISNHTKPGVYYNSPYLDFFRENKLEPKKKILFTSEIQRHEVENLSDFLSYDEFKLEYFRPHTKGCFHFPKISQFTYTKNDNIKRSYSERIDDFVEFILKLNMASQLEEVKRRTTSDLEKERDTTGNSHFFNDFLNTFNFSMNNYLKRNTVVSDYSNKKNPYSFSSQSLCGILANIMLWDSIGGKKISICSNEKCKKYYFNPGNKMNCSDPCRQASLRYRKKTNKIDDSLEKINRLFIEKDKNLKTSRKKLTKEANKITTKLKSLNPTKIN